MLIMIPTCRKRKEGQSTSVSVVNFMATKKLLFLNLKFGCGLQVFELNGDLGL